MTLYLGSTGINKVYLGSTEIKKAYLGSTLVHDKTGGGGVPTTFSGFTIDIPADVFVELFEVMMVDHDDNEFFLSLTPMPESYLTYASIAAGQYTTDSTYGPAASNARLSDGSPDLAVAGSARGGSQWSVSDTSGIKVFVKPSTARSIKELYIAMGKSYGDPVGFVQLYAGDSATALTPTSSPADGNDVYQTTDSSDANWYQWVYGTNP